MTYSANGHNCPQEERFLGAVTQKGDRRVVGSLKRRCVRNEI